MKTTESAGRIALAMLAIVASSVLAEPPAAGHEEYPALAKPGAKIELDAEHYFTYGFDKPPKLGTAIMRVEIFRRDGSRDTSFTVRGDTDMPAMRGAHGSGQRDFSLSDKGVYLMPVRIVMPGTWEVRFEFLREGRSVFRGAHVFEV